MLIYFVLLIYDWGIPIATFDYRMVIMLEDCRVLRGVNKTWFYAVAGGFKHVAAISGMMIPNDAMTFISLFFVWMVFTTSERCAIPLLMPHFGKEKVT